MIRSGNQIFMHPSEYKRFERMLPQMSFGFSTRRAQAEPRRRVREAFSAFGIGGPLATFEIRVSPLVPKRPSRRDRARERSRRNNASRRPRRHGRSR